MRDNRVMFHPSGEIETQAQPASPLAEVFDQPPPRQLPPEVERRVGKSARSPAAFSLLFGGIFLLVGLPLSAIFFPWHIADSFRLSRGPSAVTAGQVTSVERTSISVNHQPVHRLFYRFEVGEKERDGRCYFTGGNYGPGCPVRVRHLQSQPELNCLEGGNLDPGGNFTLFVIIFPLIGAVFFVYGLWAVTVGARRSLNLAREGFLAEGRVTEVTQTSLRVNRRYRYRIAVEFDAMGPQRMTYSAYGPDVDRAQKLMGSSAVVHVLYDRHRPERALLIEHILG